MAKTPLGLFHTLKGPVIGHVGKKDTIKIRVYAPAMIGSPAPGKVIFLPILFCEEYIELFWTTMFGISPPPDVVAQGYQGYFKQFIEGSYKLQPIILDLGMPGSEHVVEDLRVVDSDGLAPCPACKQAVSHWTAHYPVRSDEGWVCEVAKPDLRDTHPHYDAVAVMDELLKMNGGSNGSATR